MPPQPSPPIDPPAPAGRVAPSRAWRIALVCAGLALIIAFVVDRWHERQLLETERARVRMIMTPYATSLHDAVQRRVALLVGLRSFVDSRRTRQLLDDEFPVFAQGMLSGSSGVRALQLVERGRIVATWPLAGNEAALNYDLLSDPRPDLGGDVRRAMSTGAITVTGPVALVQGGEGLLVRQRVTARAGFPELAAVVLDVPTIISEGGIPASAAVLLEARDRRLAWFGGSPSGSAIEPETLVVRVPDGDWLLLGSPVGGWSDAIRPSLTGGRVTSIALIIVAGLLGLILGGREERLVREVAQSGTRLDLALRAGHLGAWEFDVSGRQIVWSEAAASIFGYALDALDGDANQFFDRVHPDDRRTLRKLIGEMLSGVRLDYVTEFRVVWPDGTLKWVLGIGELERDAMGRPTRMLGVVSDASERREIEERLRHSQRLEAVGTLAGGVAHDFNNLLTAIIGFSELAYDRAARMGESPEVRAIQADLNQVLMTADRAASLTGQLLAFSRRKITAPSPVDVSIAVQELDPMLRRLLGDGNELRTELTPGLLPIWIDPGQLTQVMLNLIVNARDAMPEHGVVMLRTFGVRASGSARPPDAPTGDWVCLEFADSGIGMSAELQARIFEPYFTTKEVGRGTGLGLAVVYGAVESAGGLVTVASSEGKGTVFRIYFPPRRATDEHAVPLGAMSAAV